MRSARADLPRRAARPSRAGGFLLVLVLLVGVGTSCSRDVEIEPPKPSGDSASARAAHAQDALDDLEVALAEGNREDAVALAAPPARELLGWVHDNAAALQVRDLSVRYLDDGAPITAQQSAALGDDSWVGTVELTYRFDGFDQAPARVETDVVFARAEDEARIGAFGGPDVRTPLWLAGRLSVERTPRALVLVAGEQIGRYPALAERAVRQVQRVLTSWRGSLVVEVPASAKQLDAALQANPGQYDNIAAVTTTADGSLAPGAPVRVFVNPSVFGKLKQQGAQVVMTHEATHAAAEAPFASMPTWLLEGFADYVALDNAGVPVPLAAGQILRKIRKEGLPDGLPTSADLDPSASGLGATYEEAWLACRYLAREYGGDRMVAFYQAVDDGASADEAFRSVLGTSQRAFVAGWRRDLARLAGVTG